MARLSNPLASARNIFDSLATSIATAVSAALVFLLRDEFSVDQAAPITSPRTCEPGPGTLVIYQTTGQFSVSGGVLNIPTTTDGTGTSTQVTSQLSYSRYSGLMVYAKLSMSGFDASRVSPVIVVDSATPVVYGATKEAIGLFNSTVISRPLPSSDFTVGTGTLYDFAIVLRTSGSFALAKISGNWYLVGVNYNVAISPVYFSVVARHDLYVGASDSLRICDLSAPWSTDYGIATARIASASAGDTIVSEANALVEATWTAVTGETYELSIRRTDNNNRWIVRGSQAGSTVKLIEMGAGVETERSSAAQTWTNGTDYRIVVIQDGNTIRTYVNNISKNGYTSALFNNTATGVKTSHAAQNLCCWPRVLSGNALAELQRWMI